jgi:beta-1,4-mannooligosaccharide/beta-1,4-mannosyl-N-acetylglucosamine phosphorylase
MTNANDPRRILVRHPAYPILDPEQFSGIHALFNPAPIRLPHDRLGLLVSCVVYGNPERSFRETRLAVSDDGIHFDLAERSLFGSKGGQSPVDGFGGAIDCRVTQIGEEYYILTPQGTRETGFAGCCTVMYRTRDFEAVDFVDVVALPFNRGSSLFPERIEGYYWRLDRPGEGDMRGNIWLARSPDLIHWGGFRPLLGASYAIWNTGKIGPTPPIRVPQGWLVLIHGVDDEPCDGPHYSIGALMLDKQDITCVLGRTQSPLLIPKEPYETNGNVDNVVFPCGALANLATDELSLYYGAADTRVCLATGSLSQVVQACLEGR